MPAKVPFDPDKRTWQPSVLPGQIVLVSTVDGRGRPNVAPKSWLSPAAFAGPIVAFGCTDAHATLRNAEAQGEFVVNVVPAELADTVWAMADDHGAERLARSGLALVPARRVAPPLVAQCTAHLECVLEEVRRFGPEAFVFGRVVAASIDADCLAGEPAERYRRLRPVFFLEPGWYAPLGEARPVARG